MSYLLPLRYCLILGSAVVSAFATASESSTTHYDKLLSAYHEVYGFSGTVKIVTDHNNDLGFEKSYGFANRSFAIPNTPETRTSINSISKTFTAVAVLMLAEEKKINLQDTVGNYLPLLTAEWKHQITVHHLLTHTAGLPRESGVQDHEALSFAQQIEQYVNHLPLLFSPGERYEYSNAGVTLLGAIIEHVANDSYAGVITSRIIAPLGLENTGVYRARKVVTNQAVPYRFTRNGVEFTQRSKHWGDNAGGGLYSTPSDLHTYVRALQTGKLLPESRTKQLFARHIATSQSDYEGYGWSIKQVGDDTLYFAAGSGYGTKSVMIQSADADRFIAITANWGNTPVLKLLGDLYILSTGGEVNVPDSKLLARPSQYSQQLGDYRFNEEAVRIQMGMDNPVVTLQAFEGKLFMNDELMVQKREGVLGLTYTDELQVTFAKNLMRINLNGNVLEGKRLK